MNTQNDNKNNGAARRSLCLRGLLFIVFLVLKLLHVIEWSWWWVTAPLWMPIAIVEDVYDVIVYID